MNKIQVRRLEKLATHLESGKLGHEKFDFSQYNNSYDNKCGTMGCALGELPILFKRDWKFDEIGAPSLRNSQSDFPYPRSDAMNYFGISEKEANRLFYPIDEDDVELSPKGSILPPSATRKQVAKGIRKFLKEKRND